MIDFLKLNKLPDYVAGSIFVAASAIACKLSWNLATTKRFAASLAVLDADITALTAENDYARVTYCVVLRVDVHSPALGQDA